MQKDIDSVLDQYDLGGVKSVGPCGTGRTHHTFKIDTEKGESFVLQKQNGEFGHAVLEDMEYITNTLDEKGFLVPKLVKTKNDALGVVHDDETWRIMTFLKGEFYEQDVNATQIKSAAKVLGTYHQLLHNETHTFAHKLPHYHDTPFIIEKLRKALKKHAGTPKYDALKDMAEEVLDEYDAVAARKVPVPDRIIHSDPKISNIMFDEDDTDIALTIIDLDTPAMDPIGIDLGDGARSWYNVSGEDRPDDAIFDIKILQDMMEGYYSAASFVTDDEKKSIVFWISNITLELTARFITDSLEEVYWTHNPDLYESLHEQNKTKATSQLYVYRDIKRQEKEIEKIVLG